MGFSRPEYWSGFPCPPPGTLPEPGIETASLPSPALAGRFNTYCNINAKSVVVNTSKCYLNSYQQTTSSSFAFGDFLEFFIFLSIFDLWLVESMEAEPADTDDLLCF